MRQAPDDLQAWIYLGRGYMGAGDAGDAAKAYARAVAIANRTGHPDAGLDSIYGEALVSAQGGQVSDEAAQAFRAALKLDPKEPASRFFLGDALAAHGDKAGALALWNGLLAEAPANSPLASGAGGPHRLAHRAIRRRRPIPRRWWRCWRRG